MSGKKAWNRLCTKFSPSKKIDISPIKHVCYNSAVNELTKDDYIKPQIWALLNSEEFYYQNTCSLVYHEFTNQKEMLKILKDTRKVIHWNERLEEFKLVGQGSFGDVFVGRDKLTKKLFAIKRIIKLGEVNSYAESFINDILLEKGTLYELNKSNFFVRLLGAFQSSGIGGYWLVMEYCICDLTKLVATYPSFRDNKYLSNEYVHGYLMLEVNEYLTEEYNIDYKNLVFLYLFEMLCALHYLGSRHIIHADLKMDNVLISQTGHVKMADFGLAFGDSWFYRNSITILTVNEEQKRFADKKDKITMRRGNLLHRDPEMLIGKLIDSDHQFKSILKHEYRGNIFYQELDSYEQTFLSDVYAVGFITVQLLFGGLNLKSPLEEFEQYSSVSWPIDLSYNDYIFNEYIYKIFMGHCTSVNERSVMTFLSSLFLPRSVRADGFLTDIKIFKNSLPKNEKIIDIKAVENISFYKSLNAKMMNILNVKFPDSFIKLLTEQFQPNRKVNKLDFGEEPRNVLNLPSFGFSDSKYFK